MNERIQGADVITDHAKQAYTDITKTSIRN